MRDRLSIWSIHSAKTEKSNTVSYRHGMSNVSNPKNAANRLQLILWVAFIFTIPFPPRIGNIVLILLGLAAIFKWYKTRTVHSLPLMLYLLMACYLVRIVWLFNLKRSCHSLPCPCYFFFFELKREKKKFCPPFTF